MGSYFGDRLRNPETQAVRGFNFVAAVFRGFVACRAKLPGRVLSLRAAKGSEAAATTATAHKIATIFYAMVKNQVEYNGTLWAARDAGRQKRREAKLKRQAQRLGFSGITAAGKNALTNSETGVKIYSARDRFLAHEKAMGAHEPH